MSRSNSFLVVRYRDYITLYFNGEFVCNCDSWTEIEETKMEMLGH